ncbi:hypothetical protein CDAR_205131, partial [Caerostris darwini]
MLTNESEEILPFEMDRIPEFVLRKCEVELTETPEKKLRAVQEVREILRLRSNRSSISPPTLSPYQGHIGLRVDVWCLVYLRLLC